MSRFGWGGSKASVRKAARKVSLQLEALEDRLVLDATTTFTVAAGDVATLIADINAANANGANTQTTINLTAGTYVFSSADNNTYGPNALPAITGNVIINGNGAVLERDPSLGQDTPFRFFYVSGSNVASASGTQSTGATMGSLTLNDLTLEGGLTQGGSSGTGGGGLGAGGAIFNQGNLTLSGVTVEESAAIGGSSGTGTSTSGGNFGSTTTTTNTFGVGGDGSTAGSGGVGGFGAGGGVGSAAGAGGFGAGAATSTIGGGGLGAGGAIFSMYGTTMLINCTLAGNLAEGGQGGTNGDGYGGAIFNVDGTLSIVSSTLANNSAIGATNGGGAVYNLAIGTTGGTATPTQGVPSTVTLTDSILADSIGSNDLVNDQNTSAAGAAVVNATSPNIVMASSTIDGATTNGTPSTANPQLGLLLNYGGPTPTMPLLAGSPAMGAGTAGTNVPTTDQRGVARGAVLDLGAYQATAPQAAATTTTLTATTNTTASGNSVTLTATVTAASGSTTPLGSVQFVDTTTGTVLGSASVNTVNGQQQATLTTTSLSPTSHTITATYTSTNGLGTSSGSTTLAGGSSHQQWLNQVYETLLHRPIDPSGAAYWSAALANSSPTQVVYDIEHTIEYETDQVQATYENLVGVSAPSSAVNYLVGLMQSGTSYPTIAALIAGSNEYYQAVGGTNTSFLNAVYEAFLNRPLDATGQVQWGSLMAAGYSPTQVVLGIIGTPEYLTDLVEADYQTYLGRSADTNSLNAYVSSLEGGTMNNELVVATLIGSTFHSA